jgi:hypothetical protein
MYSDRFDFLRPICGGAAATRRRKIGGIGTGFFRRGLLCVCVCVWGGGGDEAGKRISRLRFLPAAFPRRLPPPPSRHFPADPNESPFASAGIGRVNPPRWLVTMDFIVRACALPVAVNIHLLMLEREPRLFPIF